MTRLSDSSHVSRPTRSLRQAVLYISHRSADAELREDPWIKELIASQPEVAFYAMDARGCGDSQPDICGPNQFLRPYGSDYFLSAHALMLGLPYLGQKTFDMLRVLTWLRDQGHELIHLAERGWGALPTAFAILLNSDVSKVTLKNALPSYTAVAETEDYRWPHAQLLPGVLRHFDLPDVYAALTRKSLQQIAPWGAGDGMNP